MGVDSRWSVARSATYDAFHCLLIPIWIDLVEHFFPYARIITRVLASMALSGWAMVHVPINANKQGYLHA